MTTLEADREIMETQEEILDRLRLFVTQERTAEDMADQGSLDRAEDIVTLYESKAWVQELPEVTTRRNRGHPVDPESFSRFTKWLEAKTDLKGRRAYQLRDAGDLVANYLNSVQINPSGEGVIRPLRWLRKNDHGDAIAGVWSGLARLQMASRRHRTSRRRCANGRRRTSVVRVPGETKRGGQAAVDRFLKTRTGSWRNTTRHRRSQSCEAEAHRDLAGAHADMARERSGYGT